jgi:Chemotaxis protein histidine kinase and related kinases
VDECVENLDIMENGLLRLTEGDTDLELVNEIFRAAHSIKGGGGTFGFMEITDFTHGAETLLDQVRSNKREITAPLVSLQLAAVDVLRGMMDSLTAGEDLMNDRVRSVHDKIEAMLNDSDDAPAPTDTADAESSGSDSHSDEPAEEAKVSEPEKAPEPEAPPAEPVKPAAKPSAPAPEKAAVLTNRVTKEKR